MLKKSVGSLVVVVGSRGCGGGCNGVCEVCCGSCCVVVVGVEVVSSG